MPSKKVTTVAKLALCLLTIGNICEGTKGVLNIDICREKPENDSRVYCSCEEQVISCDFSAFESDQEHEFILNGWNDNANTNIKRLCFCGGPHTLDLAISPNIFLGLRQLHRVDFYNIPGVIHLRNAFSSYFSGDLFASRVRINTIHPIQFGAADPFTIEDVSDLKCCSKISVPQKFNHPTFYMEDSKIGKISANGIHNSHLWKNFIWKNVSVNIDDYGIRLRNPGMNVSITGCTFHHTNATAISFRDAANILLQENKFTNKSHFHAIELKSTFPNSNVLMLKNDFSNKIVLEIDASKIMGLFNHFDLWDNYTFYSMSHTKNKDRLYMMSLNSIQHVERFEENSIPSGPPQEIQYFYENILGTCSCNESGGKLPPILKDTRCEYHDPSGIICNPTVDTTGEMCTGKDHASQRDCLYEEKALSEIPMDYFKMIKDFLHVHHRELGSPFIESMLQASPHQYEVMPMKADAERFIGRNSSSSQVTKPYHLMVLVLLTVFIFFYSEDIA